MTNRIISDIEAIKKRNNCETALIQGILSISGIQGIQDILCISGLLEIVKSTEIAKFG